MEIARLNVRIIFQKNEAVVDAIGNHKNGWRDYYGCHATIGGEGGREMTAAGIVADDSGMTFSVRFCRKVSEVTNTGYRIIFNGEIYDILSVDHMNFKKKCMKFQCRKARR